MAEIGPLLQQGDASSALWKPPRGYDGTPNESAADVLVRARQAMSVMETQYDEETVVIVAPDSTVLSVLQAALLGVDLRSHWSLYFRCGPVALCKMHVLISQLLVCIECFVTQQRNSCTPFVTVMKRLLVCSQ
jgi:broad specificity phosphatase PhoE